MVHTQQYWQPVAHNFQPCFSGENLAEAKLFGRHEVRNHHIMLCARRPNRSDPDIVVEDNQQIHGLMRSRFPKEAQPLAREDLGGHDTWQSLCLSLLVKINNQIGQSRSWLTCLYQCLIRRIRLFSLVVRVSMKFLCSSVKQIENSPPLMSCDAYSSMSSL